MQPTGVTQRRARAKYVSAPSDSDTSPGGSPAGDGRRRVVVVPTQRQRLEELRLILEQRQKEQQEEQSRQQQRQLGRAEEATEADGEEESGGATAAPQPGTSRQQPQQLRGPPAVLPQAALTLGLAGQVGRQPVLRPTQSWHGDPRGGAPRPWAGFAAAPAPWPVAFGQWQGQAPYQLPALSAAPSPELARRGMRIVGGPPLSSVNAGGEPWYPGGGLAWGSVHGAPLPWVPVPAQAEEATLLRGRSFQGRGMYRA